MRDPLDTYRFLRDHFKSNPDLQVAHAFMEASTRAWQSGHLGDATYVREVLEPVRSYLLAGNTPVRDGKPELEGDQP